MADETVERKLAVVMIADIVGYSGLMARDESATLKIVGEHLFALVNPMVGQHHGRIIKNLGDGFLVEFQSVAEAVSCAVAIQDRMVSRNQNCPEEQAIRFRIGINIGDVMIYQEDVFGDGVNISARLQEIAEPYGVMVSSAVFGQLGEELLHSFKDTGAHQLKNIPRAVRAYQYVPGSIKGLRKAAFRPFVDEGRESEPLATGGCLCGKVRYEVAGKTIGSMLCHCRICQRFSGAPVLEGTTFRRSDFRLTKGKPKYYQSSKIAKRGFCPDCGSPILYQGLVSFWKDWVAITTGSLDEPEKFPPTYHLGIESSLSWLKIHDDLPRTACRDSPSLISAYREVGQEVP